MGKRLRMSLSQNKTGLLWRSFMQQRKEIIYQVSPELYSLQIYDPYYFKNFSYDSEFEKWALVEVSNFDHIPNGMKTIVLNGGMYAVFVHKGPGSDQSIFEYIFKQWLPNSKYCLDDRPHFEVLGEKYRHEDPLSEEEIWIPIKAKVE